MRMQHYIGELIGAKQYISRPDENTETIVTRWGVQSEDTIDLFDSEEEARNAVHEILTRAWDRAARDIREEEEFRQAAIEAEAAVELDGLESTLSARDAGRLRAILSKKFLFEGRILSRRDLVRHYVYVLGANASLETPDGKQLSCGADATCDAYAAYLIGKQEEILEQHTLDADRASWDVLFTPATVGE